LARDVENTKEESVEWQKVVLEVSLSPPIEEEVPNVKQNQNKAEPDVVACTHVHGKWFVGCT